MNTSAKLLRWMALAAAGWGLLFTLLIGLGWYDGHPLSDDAFYYFEIARNAARGEGFTFDSLGPTNGFHPLWAVILLPLFHAWPDSPWLPIRLALVLSAWMTAAAAFLLCLAFQRRALPLAGLLAGLFWLINPFTPVVCLQGLEGALNVLCLAGAFLFLDSLQRSGKLPPARAVGLGLLLGLCLLARTENLLWLVATLLVLFLDARRAGRLRQMTFKACLILLAAALLVSPWAAWNLSTFGTLEQTSGASKRMFSLYGNLPPLYEATDLSTPVPLQVIDGSLGNLARIPFFLSRCLMREEYQEARLTWVFLAGLALYLLLLLLAGGSRARRTGRAADRTSASQQPGEPSHGVPASEGEPPPGRGFLLPLGLFALLHLAAYAWIFRNYYSWYLPPLLFAFSAWQGVRLARLAGVAPGRRGRARIAAWALILVASSAVVLIHNTRPRESRWFEKYYREAFAWRLEVLEPGTRVGLWNAGAAGYFSSFHFPELTVINLDGVVNNAVTAAARQGRYEDYILETVQVFLESPRLMEGIVGAERTERFFREHVALEETKVDPPAGR